MPISAKESLKKLSTKVKECKKCPQLVKNRVQPVPGVGASNAKIIIAGYFPSEQGAEKTGVPYTNDESGKLLRKIIEKINISVEKEAYLTYVVKCTPRKTVTLEDNKKKVVVVEPRKTHINNCILYLSQEISIVTPHIIISMGLNASNIILEKFFSINKKYHTMKCIHMKIFENPSFKLVPFYQPEDVVLHNIIPEEEYIKDFKKLSKLLKII